MSARLKAARLNKGLTLKAAAKQIGISEDTLTRAEAGLSVPRPAHAKAICDFYDFMVTDIWPVDETVAA